jgi:hypothetical protein
MFDGMCVRRLSRGASHLAARRGACVIQRVRLQLVRLADQEVVGSTLVDKHLQRGPSVALDQQRRVVRLARSDAPQIAREGLLTPRAVRGVADGRERRDRGERAWVLQCER